MVSLRKPQFVAARSIKAEILFLRTHFPHTKIAVGFGVSNEKQAAAVAEFADGVIIGSLLVNSLEQHGLESFQALAKTLCEAISKKCA